MSNKIKPVFDNRFYCKKELAKILGIGVRTVDAMMKRNQIEYKKIGRMVRFNGNYLNSKYGQ